MMQRVASIERKTKETDIALTLNLDGTGQCSCRTGVGFFDHMLSGFAKHGLFDLDLKCDGDLFVDSHHSIEDVGIVLGLAIKKAVGDKRGIRRYGSLCLPMDDVLILCAVDLSGRAYLSCDAPFTVPKLGEMDTEMVHDFFHALSSSAEMNIHIKKISGFNNHHIAEGCFKAFAKALDMAVMQDSRIDGVLSTKGSL